jgi:hypothetical protein
MGYARNINFSPHVSFNIGSSAILVTVLNLQFGKSVFSFEQRYTSSRNVASLSLSDESERHSFEVLDRGGERCLEHSNMFATLPSIYSRFLPRNCRETEARAVAGEHPRSAVVQQCIPGESQDVITLSKQQIATDDQTNAFIDRVTGLMEQYWTASTKRAVGQQQ